MHFTSAFIGKMDIICICPLGGPDYLCVARIEIKLEVMVVSTGGTKQPL